MKADAATGSGRPQALQNRLSDEFDVRQLAQISSRGLLQPVQNLASAGLARWQ